jgi:hypothetical protein
MPDTGLLTEFNKVILLVSPWTGSCPVGDGKVGFVCGWL